ncbi:MAG TPA: hypothetical protein VGK73_25055 [Polyangiaceae bacterium]
MSSTPFAGRLAGGVLVAALSLLGCGGPGQSSRSPTQALPPYSPEAARLFDDTFAPVAFGFDSEARDLSRDPKLRERTRVSDFILPARVETISRVGGVEHRGAYEVTLAPAGPPLAGDYAGGPVVLAIPSSNSSYAWLEGAGARWVGTRVVVFGRFYAGTPEPELHVRCEADTRELRDIIARDAGLRLLR